MENTFVTRMEGNEYLVITNEDNIVETAKMKFEDVKVFNVVSETDEIVDKMITLKSASPNAYHVRQVLGIITGNSNHATPKDEIDMIAANAHVQRNTLIAIAFNQAKANSILKIKKVLGDNFDETILKVKELMK